MLWNLNVLPFISLNCSEEYQTWRRKDENKKSSAFFCINIANFEDIRASGNDNLQDVTFKTLEDGLVDQNSIVAFADPCTLGSHPGWPLRNLLLLLAKYCPERLPNGLMVMCFRQQIVKGESSDTLNIITAANSLILRVSLVCLETPEIGISDSLSGVMEDIFKGKLTQITYEYYCGVYFIDQCSLTARTGATLFIPELGTQSNYSA